MHVWGDIIHSILKSGDRKSFFSKYTPINTCQLVVGPLLLCFCETMRIQQGSSIRERINPSKVMVPTSFWQVCPTSTGEN